MEEPTGERQQKAQRSSEIPAPRKIFRIPRSYANLRRVNTLTAVLGEIGYKKLEFDTVDLFRSKGYQIERGGKFNRNNPEEIGIDGNLVKKGQLETDEYLSIIAGTEMPRRLSLDQVVNSDEPIVAKAIEEHGGNAIYYLETKEQKARFISWILSMNGVESVSQLKQLVQRVKEGDVSPAVQTSSEGDWYFEEYVETPSEYDTSFRIVTDCFGHIHYGVLTRSAQKKGSKNISDVLELFGQELTEANFIELATIIGVRQDVLINAPTSPLYLGSKFIVSNAMKGGRVIPLNGQAVTEAEDRNTLIALNIDPDNPQIPDELIKTAKVIGPECRGDYPFVGIDFLQDKDGKYLYLETNLGPGITPEMIGLPRGTDQTKTQLHLTEKIISSRN